MIKEVNIKEKKNSLIYRKIIELKTTETEFVTDLYFSSGNVIVALEFKDRNIMEAKIKEVKKTLDNEKDLSYTISGVSIPDDEISSFDLYVKLTDSLYINAM